MEENTNHVHRAIEGGDTANNKYAAATCDNTMAFEECELAILRQAIDTSEDLQNQRAANSPDVSKIIQIVEDFLRRKKCICYGGTAINNILPKFAQFYDRTIDVPDYDFFSPDAIEDTKELADLYAKEGYDEIEAKAGMHAGTFKVFVNFIPVADITFLHPTLFLSMEKETVVINGIRYAPPNFLRMSMYLELSRPQGNVSRWEKVLKRISLLNQYFPLTTTKNCATVDFQRRVDESSLKSKKKSARTHSSEELYFKARDALIDQGVVFFGGYGVSLYSRYMNKNDQHQAKNIPDFDVLAEDPEFTANLIVEQLHQNGFSDLKIKLTRHLAIGEVIPYHVEVTVNDYDTIVMLYKPIACHSYNSITVQKKEIRVATIDTMLSLYLAFLYGNKPYFNHDRILCMATYLFNVQQKNRLEQRGLLKRFSLSCYGHQETVEEIRAEKTHKYAEFRDQGMKPGQPEYDYWFLKYIPESTTRKRRKRSNVDVDDESSLPSRTMTLSLPSVVRQTKHPIRTLSRTLSRSPNLSRTLSRTLSRSRDIEKTSEKKKTRRRKRNPHNKNNAWPYKMRKYVW